VKITFQLEREAAEYLVEVLSNTTDDGPDGAGWKSDELCRLIAALEEALSEQLEQGK
jgi:hypothetical protein